MGLEKELENLIYNTKMGKCELCHNAMEYLGSGKYVCTFCGVEVLTEFGKIKQYLIENGPTPSGVISQKTGISIEVIDAYLRKGMVEIREGEKYYLSCEKCGCDIRYGRYCPECVKQELRNDSSITYQDIGEKPKQENAKMHFLNRKKQ